MISKSIRPENASPVTALEFYNALIQLWSASGRYPRRNPLPKRLGLAVSGGGDSMALAYLCKQLVSERLLPESSFKAFVVDHQSRKESTEEATEVHRWIENLGLQSTILTLQWPRGSIPAELSDFETQARILRYQALGKACRDNNIPSLLLGHHLDDNIETAIMRLSQGQRGLGLKGVPNSGPIPECHGIYGVSGSGGIMDLADLRSSTPRSNATGDSILEKSVPRLVASSTSSGQIPISDGGISILRPFNSFPKSRLLATCIDNGVPFVNDPTNFDFGLTPRNTVRYLLSSGRLPEAFQPPSVLKMIEERKAIDERLTAASNSILKESHILDFDRRSGKLVIQFPDSLSTTISAPKAELYQIEDFQEKKKAEALAIRRVLDVISPSGGNSLSLEDCRQLPKRIFPEIEETPLQSTTRTDKFTLGGVQFQRAKVNGPTSSQSNTWLLTREPFRSSQTMPITTITVPASSPGPHNGNQPTKTPWSEWHLWDNRYWLRVQYLGHNQGTGEQTQTTQTPTSRPHITIRPLLEQDLSYVRNQPTLFTNHAIKKGPSSNNQKREENDYNPIKPEVFNKLLSGCAPDRVRFTLPVLTDGAGEKERVLALPTLGILLPSHEESATLATGLRKDPWSYTPHRIRWEIMYKKVDREVLELTQAVV